MKYLIHERHEGEVIRQGINYEFSARAGGTLCLRIWNLIVYLRIRDKEVGGKRILFRVDWKTRHEFMGYYFDFDSLTLVKPPNSISLELLQEIMEQGGTFYRDGNRVYISHE